MYPAAFDYLAPTSLEEALDVLSERGDEARVLAGGQSLVPMMKLRLAAPVLLVDINRVPGLDEISHHNGDLDIGALVRHSQIVDSADVADTSGAMASAAPWIADPLVRNRGTLCGSVAHCDPEGDWNSVMLAVRAQVVARSRAGERSIPIDDFILDFFTNALETGEMVTSVRIPRRAAASGGSYQKLERKIGDYATVGVATHVEIDGDRIGSAGIALTSVNNRNTRAEEAERVLVGETPSPELFAEAAEAAVRAADPIDDVRGTAEWKRQVVRTFARRGLEAALEQCRSGNGRSQ